MICHQCNGAVTIEGYISRADECPHCGSDIHCCLNCLNYEPAAHNRCLEPQAEWVSDREKSNFCDYFRPNKAGAKGMPVKKARDSARLDFDNLFKK